MALPPVAAPVVVQHNALVNAHFRMSAMEMRLFLSLLSRIGKDDDELGEHEIPVRELGAGTTSNNLHKEVQDMLKGILSRFLLVAELGPGGERKERPNLLGRPLMGTADYLPGDGLVRASFNVHIKPYLLELRTNFTKASLSHLMKLKSPAAHRIYWLLQQHSALGRTTRTVAVAELRNMLGMTSEYADRFDHFRARVLDPARVELDQTDLPFTYTTKTHMRAVSEIVFSFGAAATLAPEEPKQLAAAPPALVADTWQALLLGSGVSAKSLGTVQQGIDAGTYDEGYIRYVVQRVRAEVAAGRVKKEAGAVYKGITEGHYLADYHKPAAKAAAPKAASTGRAIPGPSAAARKRLESELGDAQGSLRFVLHEAPATMYNDEQRREAAARIEAQVAALKAKLGR